MFSPTSFCRLKSTSSCMLVVFLAYVFLLETPHVGAYVSSQKLLVNTESFEAIDDGDGTTNPELRFGSDGFMLFYRTASSRFEFTRSVWVQGSLTATGSITTTQTLSGKILRVSGAADVHGVLSASGAVHFDADLSINDDRTAATDATLTFGNATLNQTLRFVHAAQKFRFSTSLDVGGTISGSALAASGLVNCNTIDTDANGNLACGTDEGGAGSGISQTHADGRYVNQAGDTMTGGLLIKNGSPTATIDAGLLLEVAGSASGKIIHAQDRLASSGVLVLRPSGNAQPTLYANGTQKVGINTATPHSSFTSSGTFATSVRTVTSTGSINGGDQIIFASGSSMITLTLPSAVGINGRQYTIKKTSSTVNTNIRPVVIATTSSQTIDRVSSWRLLNRGQQVTVISDGANWQVIESSSYGLNGGFTAMGTTMNQWYSAPSNGTALGTAVLTTTATIRVIPFVAQKVMAINGMAVSVQTTAASAEVRLAIYNDTGRGYPDKLVYDAGAVTTTSTGVRSICPSGCTVTNATVTTIQPGLYWLAINNNSIAHTLRGFAVGGMNPATGFPSNYTTARVFGWNVANAYGAFPASFPGNASATTAVPLPAVTIRIQD